MHDVGMVKLKNDTANSTRYFINVAGFGFSGCVAERIELKNKWLKVGAAGFVLGMADALFRYTAASVHLYANGNNREGRFINLSIGICRFAGGGMKLTPDSIADDGLFDVTVAGDLSKAEVIANIPRLFSGSFVRNKKVIQFRTDKIRITSVPQLPIETDGEFLGYGEAEIEIIPSAIKTITD